MKRKLLCIGLAAASFVGLALWIRHLRGPSPSSRYGGFMGPDSDSEVAKGIRLLGVQPAGSDDLLDANGRKIGEMFALIDNHDSGMHGGRYIRRCFVLELPNTAERILFHGQFSIRSSYEGRMLGGSTRTRQVEHAGKRLLIYDASIPADFRESGLFSNYAIPVEKVDLSVLFYHGPPGYCQASFAAPFSAGPTVATQGGYTCTLTINQQGERLSPDFIISANRRLDGGSPVLIYDKDGKRHTAQRGGYSSSGRSTTMNCNLGEFSWDRVARIVIGEWPQRRTFRNILVLYPDRPDRKYPEHIHAMAEALGRPVEEVAQNGPANAAEAVKVMELARGRQIGRVCNHLLTLKLDDLPAEELAALRKTAASWMASPSPTARLRGVKLGMMAGVEQSVTAALKLLESEDSSVRSQASYAVRRYCKKLSAQDLRRITRMLLSTRDPAVAPDLVACLTQNTTPAATDALWELAGADEAGPWLWWRAAEALKSRKPERDRQSLPKGLRLRLILAAGPQKGEEQLAAEARRMLPELLTPQCSRVDGSVFWRICDELIEQADRPTATRAMVEFLRRVDTRSYSTTNTGRAVKQLNLWYAVNLGGLGWDADRDGPDDHKKDWPAIIDEAVRWHDSGGPDRPAAADTAARCRFGPVVEKSIRTGRSDDLSYIDLDTCKLLARPRDVYSRGHKAR
ncbi:MAG: hypothetical protein WBF17_08930, partial [Phycisphaerae bacterium]